MTKTLFALVAVIGAFAAACGSDSPTVAADAAPADSEVAAEPDGEPAEEPEAEPAEESGEGPEADTADESTAADGFPVEVAGVTIDARPERIVSLSTVATEILYAIGAGDQVVAVDSMSNYPAGAPVTDLSSFEPNIEAIASHEPDLVFISFDPGDVVAGLETLGIPAIFGGTALSLDDTYTQIEQAGAATGHLAEAVALVGDIQTDLADLAARAPEAEHTYFHEIDNTYYTVTSSSFAGEIYAMANMVSIADPADPDGFGFPQLSEEFILDADPDYIFLADALYGESIETVAARPGWDQLSAVTGGRVIEVDADISSRWGPRVVEFLETIIEALETAPVS